MTLQEWFDRAEENDTCVCHQSGYERRRIHGGYMLKFRRDGVECLQTSLDPADAKRTLVRWTLAGVAYTDTNPHGATVGVRQPCREDILDIMRVGCKCGGY